MVVLISGEYDLGTGDGFGVSPGVSMHDRARMTGNVVVSNEAGRFIVTVIVVKFANIIYGILKL